MPGCTRQELEASWQPISFMVTAVHLISRPDYHSPFRIRYEVPLGGASGGPQQLDVPYVATAGDSVAPPGSLVRVTLVSLVSARRGQLEWAPPALCVLPLACAACSLQHGSLRRVSFRSLVRPPRHSGCFFCCTVHAASDHVYPCIVDVVRRRVPSTASARCRRASGTSLLAPTSAQRS